MNEWLLLNGCVENITVKAFENATTEIGKACGIYVPLTPFVLVFGLFLIGWIITTSVNAERNVGCKK